MKKKLVESVIGIKTTEPTARKIESLVKALPKTSEYEFRRKAGLSGPTEVEADQRTDISFITTNAVDRDHEIVIPDGIDLADYRANPIVLYGHDQDKPVGKCLWIKPKNDGLTAKTKYPIRPTGYEGEWLSDFVFGMVQAEVLKGKSVGFLPLEMRDPTPEEIDANPDVKRVISKSLLLEYSVVSIPSNPTALVEAVSKGLPLDLLGGFKVIGKIRPQKNAVKERSQNRMKAIQEELEKVNLDPTEIANEAIRKVLMRWGV